MAISIRKAMADLAERRHRGRRDNFLLKQTELGSLRTLSSARELGRLFDHSVLNGRAKEVFLMDLLRPYTFPGIGMCTGTIFDNQGQQSDQIDVIVYDKKVTPPVLLNDVEGAIPYESVLATIEVKSRLTMTAVKQCVKNAWSVKTLSFNQDGIQQNTFGSHGNGHVIHSPICAMFAFESTLAISHPEKELSRLIEVVTAFNNTISHNNISMSQVSAPISLMCVAKSATFECTDANNGSDPKAWHTTKIETGKPANIVRFVCSIIDTCTRYSLERGALCLKTYLEG